MNLNTNNGRQAIQTMKVYLNNQGGGRKKYIHLNLLPSLGSPFLGRISNQSSPSDFQDFSLCALSWSIVPFPIHSLSGSGQK